NEEETQLDFGNRNNKANLSAHNASELDFKRLFEMGKPEATFGSSGSAKSDFSLQSLMGGGNIEPLPQTKIQKERAIDGILNTKGPDAGLFGEPNKGGSANIFAPPAASSPGFDNPFKAGFKDAGFNSLPTPGRTFSAPDAG